MTVIEKHRIVRDIWAYGKCEKCGHNPREVEMVKKQLISGDPEGTHKSKEKMWICTLCGYTRKF